MTEQAQAIAHDDEAIAAPPTPARASGDRIFVWLIWAIMTAAALIYVARYGSNVPSWDEWDMVPALTGNQQVTWEWLWSQHNEHRIPVPRLLLLAIGWAFGIDFRAAMYANVLMASLLSAGAIWAVQRERASPALTDAVIPLLLLNLGQGLNFIWGWQIEFFASTTLAGAALILIVLWGRKPGVGLALSLGSILALLVGTGAHGVALVPALATWLLVAAALCWREADGNGKVAAAALALASLAGFAMTAAYFVGFEKVPYHPSSPGLRASARTSLQFLTMGFGPAVRQIWPASGILLASMLAASGLLGLWALRESGERTRALGLLAFLGAMGCLALGIGLGRDGFEPRYITLAVPAVLAAYFLLRLYAPDRLRTAGQWAMLIAAVLALWPNTRFGIKYAREARANLAVFEHDVAAGVRPYQLIHDYGGWLHPHPDVVGDYLPMLRQAGVESYVGLADNPPFQEIQISLVPVQVQELDWDAATSTAKVTGYRSHLVFELDQPTHVIGIRLRYTHTKPSGGIPYVSIYWKNGETDGFDASRFSKYSATGDRANWRRGTLTRLSDSESEMTVWVLDTIDAIRIHPDFEPCSFTIHELKLLVDE